MVREASFMSIQASYNMSNINIGEFEVRQKVSKNSRWPVIWNCQKWNGFLLNITSSIKLQMKFCPTWKFKILLSHFQKVQEHPFLICGWQVMIKSLARNFELQAWITFASKGQFMWFFFEKISFDPLYSNHSLHFIKNHHTKSAFFKWIQFEFWWEKRSFWKAHIILMPNQFNLP